MARPLVIFHSLNGLMHCDDGFGAAWVTHLLFSDQADYWPGVYGEEPPDVTDRNVILVDFSYSMEQIYRMGKRAKSILIIDHHKTADERLQVYRIDPKCENFLEFWSKTYPEICEDTNQPKVAMLYDVEHSGAMLTWNFFFQGQKPPELLRYIEDADLWRHSLLFSLEVQAAIRSYPQEFEVWDRLVHQSFDELIATGSVIRRFIAQKLTEVLRNSRMINIAGFNVPAVNCSRFLSSEAAGLLAEQVPSLFGAAYEDGATQRVWSLRSVGDFDVSAVAKSFGGGGHKRAAGFQSPIM